MTSLSQTWISYPTPEGDYRAFCVAPPGAGPWPALIVVHGASGLDPSHRLVTADLAAQGYLAIAPDIYSNDDVFKGFSLATVEAGMDLGRHLKDRAAFMARFPAAQHDEVERAYEWLQHRPEKTYIRPVKACHEYLRGRADVAAVGCIGFCMGGRLTAELAAGGAELAVAVIFYGIDPGVDAIPNIRCPMQGHYGATDRRITDRVPGFADAMKAAGKDFTYYVYEAGHGFAGASYLPMHNAEATAIAFDRAKNFLAHHLKSAQRASAPLQGRRASE